MFRSQRILLLPLFVIYFSVCVITTHADPITIVDQQNLAPATGTNGGPGALFGQSFTPSLPGINAVEFLMGAQNVTVTIDLLSAVVGFDGLQGNVIATSLPVFVNTQGTHELIRFNFPSTIPLNVGQTYVFRFFSFDNIGVSHSDNFYIGGQFFHAGFAINDFPATRDLVFVEGIHEIPEPATMLLLGTSLAYLTLRVRRKPYQKLSNKHRQTK